MACDLLGDDGVGNLTADSARGGAVSPCELRQVCISVCFYQLNLVIFNY
jgi:hypothetical protein